MSVPQTTPARLTPATGQGAARFVAFTVAAAATAAAAAYACVSLAFPVWVMFVGWVGYSSRVGAWHGNLANYACLVLGVVFGIGAALALPLLQPLLGAAALPVVVFVVACVVVSLRAAPRINNLACYFLGLIAFFAAQQPPTATTLLQLAAAMGVGCLAATVSTWLQARVTD